MLVNGDRLAEQTETFVVNLSNPTNATIVNGQGTGTIVDDEPRISISDVTKTEGQSGQTTLFTFTITLTISPGQTMKTITIEVMGDSKKEANETFYLDLFGNSGNSWFTKNRGIGTILNDD